MNISFSTANGAHNFHFRFSIAAQQVVEKMSLSFTFKYQHTHIKAHIHAYIRMCVYLHIYE